MKLDTLFYIFDVSTFNQLLMYGLYENGLDERCLFPYELTFTVAELLIYSGIYCQK